MKADSDNDGRFPSENPVWVRYPREGSTQADALPRDQWPSLPGPVTNQCGPDEWQIIVEGRVLATLKDGTRPLRDTADWDLYYPICLRDASEIRPRTTGELR